MLKRILYIIFALFLIFLIVLSVLSFLINPNDYRGMITDAIKRQTGYDLQLEGDLQWHLFPTPSLLSNHFVLTAPGEEKPFISAENIRFDVKLLPLFSKKINIDSVLINVAVIDFRYEKSPAPLTESQVIGQNSQKTPADRTHAAQRSSSPNVDPKRWSFLLTQFRIKNSSIIYPTPSGDILMRHVDATVSKEKNQLQLSVDGDLNYQRTRMNYKGSAVVKSQDNSTWKTITLDSAQFTVKNEAQAIDLSAQFSGVIDYDRQSQKIKSEPLQVILNKDRVEVNLNATWSDQPTIDLKLKSDQLDLNPWWAMITVIEETLATTPNTTPLLGAVVESSTSSQMVNSSSHPLTFLTRFDGTLELDFDHLQVDRYDLSSVKANLNNHHGQLELISSRANVWDGEIAITGSADGRDRIAKLTIDPMVTHLPINELLQSTSWQNQILGWMSGSGHFSSEFQNKEDILTHLQGNLSLALRDVTLPDNHLAQQFLTKLQQSMAQLDDSSTADFNTTSNDFLQMDLKADVKDQNVMMSSITLQSETLQMFGKGDVNVKEETMDLALNLQLAPQLENSALQKWKDQVIPVTIRGHWHDPSISFHLESLLKAILKERAEHLLDGISESTESLEESLSSDSDREIKQLKTKLLNKVINKIK